MNIIDHLTTPGNFVFTPKGELACVIAFDATTNEVEVSVSTADFTTRSMHIVGRHASEAFEAYMRAKGIWRSYHFDKLRRAPDPVENNPQGLLT